jgi:hypothetical protein
MQPLLAVSDCFPVTTHETSRRITKQDIFDGAGNLRRHNRYQNEALSKAV